MDETMLIDGSEGEGGGQILRSSLALSLLTQRPIRIEKIRAKRSKPGLKRQHLAAVRAAGEVGRAEVEGAELNSMTLRFAPSGVFSGEYQFAIQTAGSSTLVLQTVLPALMLAEGPSSLRMQGGTHNPFAPCFDFLQSTFLPLLSRCGPEIVLDLQRHGFYPAGGGQWQALIHPVKQLHGWDLLERGRLKAKRARVLISNLPRHVAEREHQKFAQLSGWPKKALEICEVEALGCGNAIVAQLEFERLTETFVAYGEKGVPAERVARNVWRDVEQYLKGSPPVGEYLADQLLLPLGLAAMQGRSSQYHTSTLSTHTTTHVALLQRFLPIEIACHAEANCVRIALSPRC